MKCSKCGYESDGNYCPICGAKLEAETINSQPVDLTDTQTDIAKKESDKDNQKKNKTKNTIIAVVLFTFAAIILGILFDYIDKNYSIINETSAYSDDDSYDSDDSYDDSESYNDEDYNNYEDTESEITYEKVKLKKLVDNCWDDYYDYVKTTIKVTKCNEIKNTYSYTVYDYDGYDKVTVRFKNVIPKKKQIHVGSYLTVEGKMKFKENDDSLTVTVTADRRTKADKSLFKAFGSSIKIPQEYKNALEKAKSYNRISHMSKKGLYDQLTSEYGENFPADAAQYAIDNLKADYKKNALITAKSYYKNQHMSKNEVYDQLVSDYGEGFTAEEAQYAVDHLDD